MCPQRHILFLIVYFHRSYPAGVLRILVVVGSTPTEVERRDTNHLVIGQCEIKDAGHEHLCRTFISIAKVHQKRQSVVTRIACKITHFPENTLFRLFLPSLIVLSSPLYPVVFLPGLEMENLLNSLVPIASEADASVVKIYICDNLSLLGPRWLIRIVVDVIKTDVILL